MGISAPPSDQEPRNVVSAAIHAYRLRWKRRRFLFRAWRKRKQLQAVSDRTDGIAASDILIFATVRNEMLRLPHFLDYYRKLGVDHFLFVDNNSDDGTAAYLKNHPDVSLWETEHSYKLSRFGVDWLTWLQVRYGHGHWCLTLDADELLVYPHCDKRRLPELAAWLDKTGQTSFGALMIDMYPKGPLDQVRYAAGDDPIAAIPWFDAGPYTSKRQPAYQNLWIQGGARARLFFSSDPRRAPTLNKIPFVRWSRRFSYVTSTHHMLPSRLNDVFDLGPGSKVSGALLHTKFLPSIAEKSREELARKQHFENSDLYQNYHQALSQNPDLWFPDAASYEGWEQLTDMGLMSKGNWV